MGYDSTNYLPLGVSRDRVEDLIKLIGYERFTFREVSRKQSIVFHYFKEDDYLSACGVRVAIREGAEGLEVDTRTNSWCSEDDMRVQNLTIRRLRDFLGGHFVTDFGKNRYFQFEGDHLKPAETGCAMAFSRFGHSMIKMSLYVENRRFEGKQWETVGQFSFVDDLNPRIFSNNVLVPYMVAAFEEYFQATFVALLKYSENKLSVLKSNRIKPEDLLAIANGSISVERAISDQFSFQNLGQIGNHFRALDDRLDIAGTLKKPYRRRRESLHDSLARLIKHRHDIIHRSEMLTEFTDDRAVRALEDLEIGVTRVYRMIVRTYRWHFIQDWGSGLKRLRKTLGTKKAGLSARDA